METTEATEITQNETAIYTVPKLGRTEANRISPFNIEQNSEFNGRYFPPSDEQVLSLALNILENGQKQPVKVMRSRAGEPLQLCSGFTRYAAIMRLNQDQALRSLWADNSEDVYPILVMVVKQDLKDAIIENISENVFRHSLTPVDQAYCHERLRRLGMTGVQIAHHCNCSPAWVSQLKGLLEAPEQVLYKIHTGEISASAWINGDVELATVPPGAGDTEEPEDTDVDTPPRDTLIKKPRIGALRDVLEDYSTIPAIKLVYQYSQGLIDQDQLDKELGAYILSEV